MAVFPNIIPSYSFAERPNFNTHIVQYGGNNEQRISLANNPRWTFTLTYPVLHESEKEELQNFYLQMRGSLTAFTWNHPSPSYVLGSDGNNYRCTKTHTADSTTEPVTGASWATCWVLDNEETGTTWVDGYFYKYEFLVRFADESNTFEMFSYKLWSQNTIEFTEVSS